MKLIQSLRISSGALLRHKLRTALAIAGLVIGIAVVLVMVGIGEGAKRQVLRQLDDLGTDMLIISAGDTNRMPGRDVRAGRVNTLQLLDGDAISKECPSVIRVAPSQSGPKRIKFMQLSTLSTVMGTTPEFREIRNAQVKRGRYFTAEENEASRRVAVIGTTVVKKLSMGPNPIGSKIRIGHIPFEVIGVLESKGTSLDGGGDEDNQILVPIKTAMRRVFNVDYLAQLYVQTSGQGALQTAEAEIRSLLRRRHDLDRFMRPDDFRVEDQALALRAEGEAADSFTAMIAGFAAVSLFVGGVGILSIMIITVKERVSEIGLRMAIGARPRDILVQFMTEALMLGVCGGTLGLFMGLASALGIGELTEWVTHIPVEWIIASMGASLLLGLGAGVYPAMRASQLDPIVALRTE